MRLAFTLTLLTIGLAALACASPSPVPEIDATSGVNAIALLSGALLVIRTRRRR